MLGFPVPVMYEVKLNFQRSGGSNQNILCWGMDVFWNKRMED